MSRRSACDRCHIQKLRCSLGSGEDLACSRCTRLGTHCSLSYPESRGNCSSQVAQLAKRKGDASMNRTMSSADKTKKRSGTITRIDRTGSETPEGIPRQAVDRSRMIPRGGENAAAAGTSTGTGKNIGVDNDGEAPLHQQHLDINGDSINVGYPSDFDFGSSLEGFNFPLEYHHHQNSNDVFDGIPDLNDSLTMGRNPAFFLSDDHSHINTTSKSLAPLRQSHHLTSSSINRMDCDSRLDEVDSALGMGSETTNHDRPSASAGRRPKTPSASVSASASALRLQRGAPKYEVRLVNLNMTLARRLQDCEGQAADRSTDKSGARISFESALSDLSEFLDILHETQVDVNEDSIPSPSASTSNQDAPNDMDMESDFAGSEVVAQLSLVAIFNLLSVYFQIVTIYDHLFRVYAAQLLNSDKASEDTDANANEHILASWSASKDAAGENSRNISSQQPAAQWSGLQNKVLVHAVLHQFEMIERKLGLPVELRVVEKSDEYMGLLRSSKASSILDAILWSTSSRGPRLQRRETTAESCYNMATFLSLRNSIKIMQKRWRIQ